MAENETENAGLTETAKMSVLNAGIVSQLQHAMHGHKADPDIQLLAKDVQAMVASLAQLLAGGGLNDMAALKTSAILARLKGVLRDGSMSREALATILSEAASVMSTAEGAGKTSAALVTEKLWQQIDVYNKEIDDDFAKMRKAGIVFDETLWNKHGQLLQYMQTHPHDISKQKELDAVDDTLLLQAEPQLDRCPAAKPSFDDAKKKSEERHRTVEHYSEATAKQESAISKINASDWDMPAKSENNNGSVQDVSMNDVRAPALPDKKSSQNFVRKQTNVCSRTKLLFSMVLYEIIRTPKTIEKWGLV